VENISQHGQGLFDVDSAIGEQHQSRVVGRFHHRYVAQQPFLTDKIAMKWDGEWHITYEVFRDLGIAFGVVLVLIFVLVVVLVRKSVLMTPSIWSMGWLRLKEASAKVVDYV